MKAQILGQGRIAQAIRQLSGQTTPDLVLGRDVLPGGMPEHDTDLIINTLPGSMGEQGLDMALVQKKHLVDLADLDDVFYLDRKAAIDRAGILVIPGCGFCPGLINFILGYELGIRGGDISTVEVKAGSLSPHPFYFPFLWCFEDQIPEFTLPSIQIIDGTPGKFPAFADLREEILWGIKAETYLGQSGFEHFAMDSRIRNFTYRNIRPRGFRIFFQYLFTHGCFEEDLLATSKALLESKRLDNASVSEIRIIRQRVRKIWQIKSQADRHDSLNSMQTLTGLFALEILNGVIKGEILPEGLIFCQNLGRNEKRFNRVINGLRNRDIEIFQKEAS